MTNDELKKELLGNAFMDLGPGELGIATVGGDYGYYAIETVTTQEQFDVIVEALMEAGMRSGFHWPKGV